MNFINNPSPPPTPPPQFTVTVEVDRWISKHLSGFIMSVQKCMGCANPLCRLRSSAQQFAVGDHSTAFYHTPLTCSPSNPIILGMDGPHISMSRRATWGTRRDQSCDMTESTILQTHSWEGNRVRGKRGRGGEERNWVKHGPSRTS